MHPYASKAKSGNASKLKSIAGKKSSGATYSGGTPDKSYATGGKVEEFKVGGAVSPPNFARGGRSKGKKGSKTNINIIIAGKDKEEAGPPMPPPMPKPPMAPPPGMAPPGGPMPPGMPPMKRGGKVPMKAGAETGQGRLDKVKAYGKKA